MPQNILKENVNLGEIVYGWRVKEYEKYERGSRWYLVMGILAVLLIGFAVISANYLFALIIVLFAIIIMLQEMNDPVDIDFVITETGIIISNKYYPFFEIEKYWIIYNPPEIKTLYFEPKSILKHRLSVPLDDIDPLELRSYLNQFLLEDLEREEEPISDRLGRILKIQ